MKASDKEPNTTDTGSSPADSWKLPLPNDDGPEEIIRRGTLNDFICQQAELGKIYIKRRLPEEEAP
jgi:hypothetical protein